MFDPRMKILLAFCCALIPFNLICHMTMFEKIIFCPPGHPKPQTLGHDPGFRMKILFDMFYTLMKFGITRKDMALSAISMNSALADKEFVLSLHHKLHVST